MHIMRSFEARMPMRQVYRPGLCVVIQGAKEILFGEETFRYGVMECLAIGLDLPASGRVIEARADAPYIGITIDLHMTRAEDSRVGNTCVSTCRYRGEPQPK